MQSFVLVSWNVLHGSERQENIINLLYELERQTLHHGPRQTFVNAYLVSYHKIHLCSLRKENFLESHFNGRGRRGRMKTDKTKRTWTGRGGRWRRSRRFHVAVDLSRRENWFGSIDSRELVHLGHHTPITSTLNCKKKLE